MDAIELEQNARDDNSCDIQNKKEERKHMVYSAPKSVVVGLVSSRDIDPGLFNIEDLFYNLKITGKAWHPSPNYLDLTADSAILHDINGATKKLTAVSLHITDLASMSYVDTGIMSPVNWYYLYLIHNPVSNNTTSYSRLIRLLLHCLQGIRTLRDSATYSWAMTQAISVISHKRTMWLPVWGLIMSIRRAAISVEPGTG